MIFQEPIDFLLVWSMINAFSFTSTEKTIIGGNIKGAPQGTTVGPFWFELTQKKYWSLQSQNEKKLKDFTLLKSNLKSNSK